MDQVNNGPAIGIDLGTGYTRVGVFDGNHCRIIPDHNGAGEMPSYVAFTDSGLLVGDAAKKQELQNPSNTVFDIMRLIGKSYSDPLVQKDMKLWPFEVVGDSNGKAVIVVTWKSNVVQFTPDEILSMILTQIKKNAERNLKATITNVVVAIPVHFNYKQRLAVRCAGNIAGLNITQLISAPAAAGLFYSLQRVPTSRSEEYNMVIFDLGAGTFDVSIINLTEDICQVQASAGDIHLGGKDINANMVDHFVNLMKTKERKDIMKTPNALINLRMECEKAKVILSSSTRPIPIEIPPLYNNSALKDSITKSKFDELNKDIFLRCRDIMDACLKEAKLGRRMVNEVILAGGSTRIPSLQNSLRTYFKSKELSISEHLVMAATYGASIQAFFLHGRWDPRMVRSLSLFDVTPFSLGIKTILGVMSVSIPKNTLIPTKNIKAFYLEQPSKFLVEVYEGEETFAPHNNLLGSFELDFGLAGFKNRYDFTISFEITVQGVLIVIGKDNSGKVKNGLIIIDDNNSLPIKMSRKKEWEPLLNEEESEKDENKASTPPISSKSGKPQMSIKMKEIVKNPEISASNKELIDDALDYISIDYMEFSLRELEEATNYFDKSKMIGEGGFGFVYKGILRGTVVAIKVPKPDKCQGDEFNRELGILWKVRHPNLVCLIGANTEAHALVFEFVPNGTLDAFLAKGENSTRKLSWQDRIRISSEICSALIFLHSVQPHGIAHGDLKPENILLDSNLVVKVTDFGLSRKLKRVKSTITAFHLTEEPKGTVGYFDPAYYSTGELTRQSDVFAFGIILLQLVTDKNPEGIRRIVEDAMDNRTFSTMVYGSPGEWPINNARKLANLGILCSDTDRAKRPDLERYVLPSIKILKDTANFDE